LTPFILFNLGILTLLALDLGIFHKKPTAPSRKESVLWSLVWLSLALLFALWLWQSQGTNQALLFLTAYVVEKSLSVDNVMVFAIIFQGLAIPVMYQHRVLFWGILSALVFRAIMIFLGALLIQKFHWVLYVFGGFLILTGIKLLWVKEQEESFQTSPAWVFLKKHLSISDKLNGQKFWVRCHESGKRLATPLMAALILVEISDIIFAVDSIPAVFAITTDPFLVYTSNVFAILGLRSLYFLLAHALGAFPYLKKGLGVILCFVGCKMLGVFVVNPGVSLLVILGIMSVSILIPKQPS
jgi:tellurite resistance protein TerC